MYKFLYICENGATFPVTPFSYCGGDFIDFYSPMR